MKHLKLYEEFLFEYVNVKREHIDDGHILDITSLEQLKSVLEEYGVDLSIWGTEGYKTVEHLWNEIEEGECIIYGVDGVLKREVNFVGAKILYIKDGVKYHLYEEKSLFKDGRERIRDIWYSMAEKFKFGEDPKEALVRGMEEELGIHINHNQFTQYNKLYFPSDGDYPGIKSSHTGYSFLITLNDYQYDPDGYIEKQSDKDIYFTWKKIQYRGNG